MISLTLLFILNGCAPFAVVPASPPLGRQKIAGIVSVFKEQETAVQTLVSSGALRLQTRGSESDATFLIVATRNPSKIKIEITHPWGRPLLHVLIKGSRLDIVSYSEKRLYCGRLGSPGLLKLIPVPLNPDLVWALARAYPVLSAHDRILSKRGNEMTLIDRKEDPIQTIELYPESNLPKRVCFCRQHAEMVFSDFQDDAGILYAGEIGVNNAEDDAQLTLEIKQIVFNNPVPEAIFKLEAPRDFEVISHWR